MTKKESFFDMLGKKMKVSVISAFGLPVFILYWIAFQWGNFTILQDIAVLLIAVFVFFAINGVNWTDWSRK